MSSSGPPSIDPHPHRGPSSVRTDDLTPHSRDTSNIRDPGRNDKSPGYGARTMHKRRRNLGSSSFRLSPTTGFGRESPSSPTPHGRQRESFQESGGQIDEGQLLVQKRRLGNHRGPSVPRDEIQQHPNAATNEPTVGSSSHVSETDTEVTLEEGEASNKRDLPRPQRQSLVGLDSDPSQIVNLALNLSESRKRSASGRAMSSGMPRNLRMSSPTPSSNAMQDSGILPKQMTTDRQYATQHPRRSSHVRAAFNSPEHLRRLSQLPPPLSTQDPMVGGQGYSPSEISHSTMARVEMAQSHFELFAEYLRLLRHLPELPASTRDSFTGTKQPARGRTYNPLQYIRNRKIRFRERSAIDSTAEGWDDVERVRNWVDAVVNSFEESHQGSEKRIEFPPFRPVGDDAASERGHSPTADVPKMNDANKPRRPRMDWFVSPSDLLADTAWVHAENNIRKLEDREGNKVFPVSRRSQSVQLTRDRSSEFSSSNDSKALADIGTHHVERLPSSTSTASKGSHNGSRNRIHRLAHSVHFSPSHSRSRNSSKSGWRRALVRSRNSSISSRGKSDDGRQNKLHSPSQKLQMENLESPTQPQKPQHLESNNGGQPVPSDLPLQQIYSSTAKGRRHPISTSQGTLLPPLDTKIDEGRLTSSGQKYAASVSSGDGDPTISRDSLEGIDDSPKALPGPGYFPSIAANLSPPPSRSTSPTRKRSTALQLALDRQDNAKQKTDLKRPHTITRAELTVTQSPVYTDLKQASSDNNYSKTQDSLAYDDLPVKRVKGSGPADPKRRGLFKNTRIAEIVGHEVSKVGGLIRKKEHASPSRPSSAASSISENAELDDDTVGGKQNAKARLVRNPIQPDTRLQLPSSDRRDHSKYHRPNFPVFSSSLNLSNDPNNKTPAISVDSHQELDRGGSGISTPAKSITQQRSAPSQLPGQDSSSTDLANSRLVESGHQLNLPSNDATKNSNTNHVDKREIIRARAHLLSTGVKALEICRHAHGTSPAASCPFLKRQPDSFNPLPYIGGQEEATAAARNLVLVVEYQASVVRDSMSAFSTVSLPSLKSDLDRLENVVTSNLNLRLHDVSKEAEYLSNELATTNTLAIKQLNDSLDKGIRKRNRRFRWISRSGFLILEWSLVWVMWCVWMIVMVWKLSRTVWRGTVAGIRWVLWL